MFFFLNTPRENQARRKAFLSVSYGCPPPPPWTPSSQKHIFFMIQNCRYLGYYMGVFLCKVIRKYAWNWNCILLYRSIFLECRALHLLHDFLFHEYNNILILIFISIFKTSDKYFIQELKILNYKLIAWQTKLLMNI